MKKYLFLLCLIGHLFALEYIYTPSPILFAGMVQGRQTLLTPKHIYVLSGRYYHQVFALPEEIRAAERSGDVLQTDKYRIDFTQGIQLTKIENKNISVRPVKPVYQAVVEIKHVYIREKLVGDNILVFRHEGSFYLSLENTVQIRRVVPVTLNFFTEDEIPQFSFDHKGQSYVYAKSGNRWNRDRAGQYSTEKLESLSVAELELLRSIIEARKGRIFTNRRIQNYLQRQNWYRPDPLYTPEHLTQQELKNIEIIFAIENAKIREGMYEQKTVTP